MVSERYKEVIKQFGLRVKAHREAKNMTQLNLANMAKISKSYITKIENGEAKNVGLETICMLAEALDIQIQDLIAYVDVEYGFESDYNAYSSENLEETKEILLHSNSIFNTFYPPLYSRYKVTTLLEFILYLPLINPYYLVEKLCRIDGDIIDKEDYVCQLIDYLIKHIPDSDAKKFADIQLELIHRKRNKHNIVFEIADQKAAYQNYEAYNIELRKIMKKAKLLRDFYELENPEHIMKRFGFTKTEAIHFLLKGI